MKSQVLRLLFSSFGAAIATLAIQLLLSHRLTKVEFGTYSTIAAVLVIAAPLCSAGVNGLLLRRVSMRPEDADTLIPIALSALVFLCATFFLGTVIAFNFGGVSAWLVALLATYYFAFGVQGFVTTLGQLSGNGRSVANTQAVLPFGRLVVLSGGLLFNMNLVAAAWLLGAANVFVGLAFCFGFREKKGEWSLRLLRLKSQFFHVLKFIASGVPYALNGVVNVAQIQIIVALAGVSLGVEAAANFSVANTLITAAYLLPNVIFGLHMLPKYHRLQAEGVLGWLPLRHSAIGFVAGAVVSGILYFISPYIIPALFSEKYISAIDIVCVLVIAIPFRYSLTAFGAALMSEYSVKRKVLVSGFAVLLQVIFILYSVAEGGSSKVAWSVVASEFFVFVLYLKLFLESIDRAGLN